MHFPQSYIILCIMSVLYTHVAVCIFSDLSFFLIFLVFPHPSIAPSLQSHMQPSVSTLVQYPHFSIFPSCCHGYNVVWWHALSGIGYLGDKMLKRIISYLLGSKTHVQLLCVCVCVCVCLCVFTDVRCNLDPAYLISSLINGSDSMVRAVIVIENRPPFNTDRMTADGLWRAWRYVKCHE